MGRRYLKERTPPSEQELVKALVDKWKFVDLLGFHGGAKEFGEIHKELLEWHANDPRQSKRDLIIMPRGHLKTTIITVLGILHDIYVNPNIRIYVGSSNFNLAKAIVREVVSILTDDWNQEHIWNNRPHIPGRLIPIMDKSINRRRQQIREQLQENDFYSDYDTTMFAEVEGVGAGDTIEASKKVVWRQEAIQVLRPYTLKEPTLTAGSAEAPVTGYHFDKIYFDDIINFQNYDIQTKVDRLDTWRNDMYAVLDAPYFDDDLKDAMFACSRSKNYRKVMEHMSWVGGDVTVVGTRYFRHDWYKKLIDEAEGDDAIYRVFLRNIYQNGQDAGEGYIWHERWSPETERQRRTEMDKKHWYAQYLNEIIVTEDQVLPFDKIKFIHASQITRKDGNPRIWVTLREEGEEQERVVEILPQIAIDPAATSNKNSDFTAIVVGGRDHDKNLYIFDCIPMRDPPDKWIRKMYEYLIKYNLKAVNLETVSYFVTLKDVIKRYFGEYFPISIRDFKPTSAQTKKERIESALEPLLTNGMLYCATWVKSNKEVQDQFNFFPNDTVHDDVPDVWAQLALCTKPTIPMKMLTKQRPRTYNTKYGGLY